MPTEKKPFKVSIFYKIEELVDGKLEPYYDCPPVYHSMDYAGVVAMNVALGELQDRLTDFGIDNAVAKGLGEKLKRLGLEKKEKKEKFK